MSDETIHPCLAGFVSGSVDCSLVYSVAGLSLGYAHLPGLRFRVVYVYIYMYMLYEGEGGGGDFALTSLLAVGWV